jgi:hypothetical protein
MSDLITLENLKPFSKSKHKEKRVGRGHGSGLMGPSGIEPESSPREGDIIPLDHGP